MHKYDTVRIIGQGAFGNAYLAMQRTSHKQCVVKRVDLHQKAKAERQNIFNEVRVLQTLQHPNIVGFHESFDEGQMLHIVMEYCEGGDLSQYLDNRKERRHRLEEHTIIDWATQIALAIFYLHDRRILHRDLKTPNIFLQGDRLKLGDFGISKVLDESRDLASTNIGTPYYMSPEQYRQKPYSYKSDMWAFGCILYEMCNLKRPFEGATYHGLAVKVLEGRFTPVSDLYSQGLRDVVRSLLNKQAKDRPTIVQLLHRPIIRKRATVILRDMYGALAGDAHTHILAESIAHQATKLKILFQAEPILTMSRSKSQHKKIKEELEHQIIKTQAVQKESQDRLLALAIKKKEQIQHLKKIEIQPIIDQDNIKQKQQNISKYSESIRKIEEEEEKKRKYQENIKKMQEEEQKKQNQENIKKMYEEEQKKQNQENMKKNYQEEQKKKKVDEEKMKLKEENEKNERKKREEEKQRIENEKRKEQWQEMNRKQIQSKKRFKMQQDYAMDEDCQFQEEQNYEQNWEQESKEYQKNKYIRNQKQIQKKIEQQRSGAVSKVQKQIQREQQRVKQSMEAADQLIHTLRQELSNIDYFILSSDEEEKRVRNPAHVRLTEKVQELTLSLSAVITAQEADHLKHAKTRTDVQQIVGSARAGSLHFIHQISKIARLLDRIPKYL